MCVCVIGKSRPVSQHAPWWHRAWQQASRVSRVAWQQHVSTATTTALPTTEKDIRQCLVAVWFLRWDLPLAEILSTGLIKNLQLKEDEGRFIRWIQWGSFHRGRRLPRCLPLLLASSGECLGVFGVRTPVASLSWSCADHTFSNKQLYLQNNSRASCDQSHSFTAR